MWDESPLFGQGPPHITLASSDKLTDSAAPPSVQAVTGTWELIDNLSRGSQRMMKLRHLYFDIKLNYQSSHYQPEKRSIHRPFIYVLTFYHRFGNGQAYTCKGQTLSLKDADFSCHVFVTYHQSPSSTCS
ncbi:Uncharacterized protein HZ326_13918 [Fusarium oxysporum f. sp. albedinis]|nr:Uncharacterized protein HZ326_13918 [Fusarium oxysporum f. sp. albedinis]